ncbi:MAG: enoyl-CoA hydratase [Hyphomicrobiaceae bacterium]|jgi:enoyl-CoA hydratase
MTNPVSYEADNGIATITMDDGKANALSLSMSEGINAALDQAATEAQVVVLRGRPGVLCGGFDLKLIRGDDHVAREAMRSAGMALLNRLFMLPQPLVIACTGHSVAAGGLILLTGDKRVGTAGDFKIGLNEVAIGRSMPVAGVELARARLTSDALTEALLLSELYTPDAAASVGYLDKVVSPDKFVSEVTAIATSLLALDNAAFAQTKQNLRLPIIDRMSA